MFKVGSASLVGSVGLSTSLWPCAVNVAKNVFEQGKKNGVYRARLGAKGYDQIAGIDFQYKFAPVTGDVTLPILLIPCVIKDYFAEVADVQAAFLHGDFEEELFIKQPQPQVEGEENYFCFVVLNQEASYLDNVPTTLAQAWHHKDPEKREKWREAIRLEFRQMIKKYLEKCGTQSLSKKQEGNWKKVGFQGKEIWCLQSQTGCKKIWANHCNGFQIQIALATNEITLWILLIPWNIKEHFA